MEDPYFNSYENLAVHQLMLKDGPRNQAYRQAILDNKDQIKGKVVLDVGAGTGILSVYFAQAGAAKVYAVEASNVSRIAEDIIKENNFANVIQVINSKVEDVVLTEKVDIIVSEWMGFYLFHEAMLNSLIFARDKYLKPGGLMFPESASLYAAPCSVPSLYEFWDNIDGLSMKIFAQKLRNEASKEPATIAVKPEHILADPEAIIWIDLREVTLDEIAQIKMEHIAVANKVGLYQGICLWFTVTFPSITTEPVTLSTDPFEPETHWKQTTIVLPNEVRVEPGTPLAYELCLSLENNVSRRYKMEVTLLDANEMEHPEYCSCHLTKCILVRAMLDKYENDSLPK